MSCPYCHSLASIGRRASDRRGKTPTYHCILCNKTWRDDEGEKLRPSSSSIVWATRSANRNARQVKRPT
jgi:transposase-like protein